MSSKDGDEAVPNTRINEGTEYGVMFEGENGVPDQVDSNQDDDPAKSWLKVGEEDIGPEDIKRLRGVDHDNDYKPQDPNQSAFLMDTDAKLYLDQQIHPLRKAGVRDHFKKESLAEIFPWFGADCLKFRKKREGTNTDDDFDDPDT